MPRSRNIKPAFFDNDLLAEVDPLGRLLFIGLWTIADFNGNLEWRPKRIKAQILPYDDCDIEEIVTSLCKSRFVTIYSCQGSKYLNVTNFHKHQNPHPNEKKKGTPIPSFNGTGSQPADLKEVVTNNDKITTSRDGIVTDPADSCFLIPDPLNPIPDIPSKAKPPAKKPAGGYTEEFETFWGLYPKKVGKKDAFKAWGKITTEEKQKSFDALPVAKVCEQWEKERGQFIPNPATWLNAGRWDDEHVTNGTKPKSSYGAGGI